MAQQVRGALTRAQTPCQQPVVPGRARCDYHGVSPINHRTPPLQRHAMHETRCHANVSPINHKTPPLQPRRFAGQNQSGQHLQPPKLRVCYRLPERILLRKALAQESGFEVCKKPSRESFSFLCTQKKADSRAGASGGCWGVRTGVMGLTRGLQNRRLVT
jgi:hypothetical protein